MKKLISMLGSLVVLSSVVVGCAAGTDPGGERQGSGADKMHVAPARPGLEGELVINEGDKYAGYDKGSTNPEIQNETDKIGHPKVGKKPGSELADTTEYAADSGVKGADPGAGKGKDHPHTVPEMAVEENRGAFTACYDKQLSIDPNAEGTVKVQVALAPDGSVATTSILENTTYSPTLASCVERAVVAIRFSEPSDGVYSFVLPITFARNH